MQLLANLANASGALRSSSRPRLVLRVGGNSQDSTCYQVPTPHRTTPRRAHAHDHAAPRHATQYPPGQSGCKGNLTIAALRQYADFSSAASERFGMNVSFVVGTNLGGVRNATLEATQIADMLRLGLFRSGAALAVEIGNEVRPGRSPCFAAAAGSTPLILACVLPPLPLSCSNCVPPSAGGFIHLNAPARRNGPPVALR